MVKQGLFSVFFTFFFGIFPLEKVFSWFLIPYKTYFIEGGENAPIIASRMNFPCYFKTANAFGTGSFWK